MRKERLKALLIFLLVLLAYALFFFLQSPPVMNYEFTPPRESAPPVYRISAAPATSASPIPAATEPAYIGNRNTRRFHRPECSYLPDEKNRVSFDFRDEAVEDGFKPCQKCKP